MTRTKKPKWTPGPWIESINVEHNTVKVCAKSREFAICTLWKENDEAGFETRQANANLIASAPEMYEALMEVLAFLDGDAHCLDLIYTIQAALKKARGIKSE